MEDSHVTLLKAFLKLLEKHHNIILKFAGDGELLEYCKKFSEKMAEKIIFMGRVKNIPAFLSKIDCYIYSSQSESFGISVVEAMYVGLPVIVSDNGPFKELTNNGKLATLFECKNDLDLYYKMEDYLMDPNFYNDLAEQTQKYIAENFSIENNFQKTFQLYHQILIN